MIASLGQEVRLALRSLTRRPLMTAAVVLSLALGIGLNVAIFSVFERVVLRQLPVDDADRIVLVTSPGPKPGSRTTGDAGGVEHVFSYPLVRDLERMDAAPLRGFAAHADFTANVALGGETIRAKGVIASGSYFPVLGVMPGEGRLLSPADDTIASEPVAVLTHDFWTRRLGARRDIVGQPLVVNGLSMTVVGIAPAGFRGTTLMDLPDVFVPLAQVERVHAGSTERLNHWLYLFSRLPSGTSTSAAEAALAPRFSAILRDVEYPVLRSRLGSDEERPFLARRIVLADGSRYRASNRDEGRLVLALLMGVTGIVLLVACVNVANLLLARATERAPEMAVRTSLGGSSFAIARLLLAEALLLGVISAGAALIVARLASTALVSMLPAGDAALLQFEWNPPIVLFAFGIGLGSALVFGLLPIWHTLRTRLVGIGSRTAVGPTRGSARTRLALVTMQVALATALVALAGLFTASLRNVSREALGFERDGLVAFGLSPYLNGYETARAVDLFDRVGDELRRTPGVRSVSTSIIPLLSDDAWGQNITVDGFSGTDTRVHSNRIGEDYFRTLGTPLLAGREFSTQDREGTPKVAVVNQAFAKRFSLDGNVVGHRIALGAGNRVVPDIEIVGLVADSKYDRVREAAPAQLFLPYRQEPDGAVGFVVRTANEGAALASIPAIVSRFDPQLPVEKLRTMEAQIQDNLSVDRVMSRLSAGFAGLAFLLAGIGLYAVLTYAVTQRLREIGLRMALGATGADVRRMLGRQVGRIGAIGIGIGVVLAIVIGRLAGALLVGLEGDDPLTLGGAALVATLMVIATFLGPAQRATRVDPAQALRSE